MNNNKSASQMAVCEKWGSPYRATGPSLKVGVADNVRSGLYPVNGLRHSPTGDTSGWYIWAGEEMGSGDDFFMPLHASHIAEWCPDVEKYLGLSPGWRFLIAPDYEDVWFDASLLSN